MSYHIPNERCPECRFPIFIRSNGNIVAHLSGLAGRRCTMSEKPYKEPSFPLYIFLKQTQRWERHDCTTVEMRDYLRAVWRRDGNCTAVEVAQ